MKRTLLWTLLAGPLWAQPGLHFERIDQASPNPATPQAKASALPVNQIEALLARLPALAPAQVKAFVFQQAQPAPKAGRRIQEPFPPASSEARPRPVGVDAPLEVLSYAPRGAVQLGSEVRVRYNRPPIPQPSAQLTPAVPGKWRWVGAQDLVFEPEGRLPMATEFEVSVQGVKPLRWSFATPAPQLNEHFPSGDQVGLQPVIYLEFNQRIDRQRVMDFVSLDGYALRAASAEEIAADPEVRERVKAVQADRWLAVVPVDPLRPGSLCTVRLLKGLPSAEGPLTVGKVQSFEFHTFPPLTIREESRAQNHSNVLFSNSLVEQEVALSSRPAVANLRAEVYENHLYLRGDWKPDTNYEITLPSGIRDVFGQTTSSERVLKFRTASAGPTFQHPSNDLVTLNGTDLPELNFRLSGYQKLRVEVFSANPKDWKGYRGRQSYSKQDLADQLLSEREIVGGQIAVNLAEEFKQSGLLLVRATPAPQIGKETPPTYQCWVQRSLLGLNTVCDGTHLLAWVTRLADGSPVAGARVSLPDGTQPVQTDAQGLARLPSSEKGEALLVQEGEERLFFPPDHYYSAKTKFMDERWFIKDDRKLYKPGETVSFKGWLRVEPHQPKSRLQLPAPSQFSYILHDSRGQKLAEGKVAMGHLGSFQFQIVLPKTVENLGYAQLEINTDKDIYRHSIQIEEYRAPEFEASTQADQTNALLGGTGSFHVQASYFAGGALKNAPVRWEITAQPGRYAPPHWEDYQFTDSKSLRWRDEDDGHKSFEASTDANGKDTLNLRFLSADEPRPYVVTAEASVKDANQRHWSSTATMLVHPAPHYVGLRASRDFIEAGKPLELQLIATDLDGKPSSTLPIELSVQQLENVEKTREISKQQLTSTLAPLNLSLPFSEPGVYKIQATLRDQNHQSSRSSLQIWVAGPQPKALASQLETQKLTLIPDKKVYQPGETARVLVQAPFQQGQLLVTQARSGLSSHQTCALEGGQAILQVPLEDGTLPNLHLNVQAVGQVAEANGEVNLEISPQSRELQVEVQPARDSLTPGASSQIEIRLKDFRNQPVANSDVALLAVDEAVLALSESRETSLLKAFYPIHSGEVEHQSSRRYLQMPLAPPPGNLQVPDRFGPFEAVGNAGAGIGAFQGAVAPGAVNVTFRSIAYPPGLSTIGLGYSGGGTGALRPGVTGSVSISNRNLFEPIRLRSNFNPLACFIPSLRSDANGRVQASFKLPDNLTRYRLIALAAAGAEQFGQGEASLTARQPLMLRPSPPRFLNQGDQARLPVLVQNQSDHPQRVQLACRASNLKVDSPGLQFEVPANDRVEVSFPIAAERAGQARVQLALSSADFEDAATCEIPVLTPASSESYASYGTLEEGAVTQPVVAPAEADPNYGGLEVSTSSTALSELFDAFLYLRKYPYECTEQLASRNLSTVALEPVLRAFQTSELPSREALRQSVQADLKKLQQLQNTDGGWDYWEHGQPSIPFPSVHVTHALLRLRQGGYAVDAQSLERGLNYVADIQNHLGKDTPAEAALGLRSYAVYVLNRAGRPVAGKARKILQERGLEQTPLECLGWLLPSLAGQPEEAAVLRNLGNRVTQTASSAEFVTRYEDGAHLILASSYRDDAILLEALLGQDRSLATKLVRGLLEHRQAGRWESTQENCWVLLALQAYFQKYESTKPDFLARLWLGEGYVGEQAFRGYSADSHELRIPLDQLKGDLTLSKQGPGRLYYRVGLKSTPLSHQLAELQRGFSVSRTYEATEENGDVRREADGSWRIKAGSRVKVTVSMVAPANRYQVALVDPLPAGLEVINPALKGGQKSRDGRAYWYQHENLRDDQVEAFSYWLSAGSYQYSYYARAITPGQFTAPPARAEEMYHPETFGRCATDRVVVVP